jgi:hypothetical protein
MCQKAMSQVDESANNRAYVSISERWAAEHGRRVIPPNTDRGIHGPT